MDALQAAAAIGRRFEGCALDAYPDPVSGGAPWTIGWGNTCHLDGSTVRAGDRLANRAEADALQLHALGLIRAKLPQLLRVPVTPSEEAALLDFCFNLGSSALAGSTLLRLLNAGERGAAAAQFPRWGNARVRGRLVPVPGLERRREYERQVFDGEVDPMAGAGATQAATPAPVARRAPSRTTPVRTRPAAPAPTLPGAPAPITTAGLNDAEWTRLAAGPASGA